MEREKEERMAWALMGVIVGMIIGSLLVIVVIATVPEDEVEETIEVINVVHDYTDNMEDCLSRNGKYTLIINDEFFNEDFERCTVKDVKNY